MKIELHRIPVREVIAGRHSAEIDSRNRDFRKTTKGRISRNRRKRGGGDDVPCFLIYGELY